jgi:peptidoglycan/LPS O-acetylase OafA/YrhL
VLILRAATGTLALALSVFWIAFLQAPFLVRTRAWPDWSYGVYIYAFPIQQLLKAFWPDMNLLVHIVVAFLLVLIPASLSWHFIERPALSLKNSKLPWR